MGFSLGPTLANSFFVYHETRKIGLNIVHWNIDHYTIEGTLMIYLFYLIQQNILNVFIVIQIPVTSTHLLLQRMKKTTACLFLTLIQSVKKTSLPLLSTENQILAEFIPVSYHPVTKLPCYMHYYIDVSGFAQIILSFTQNQLS